MYLELGVRQGLYVFQVPEIIQGINWQKSLLFMKFKNPDISSYIVI